MPDVFISYARRDSRDFVARLSAELEARDKDPWVDLEDIPPASRWERDLREGITASFVFLYVISPASVSSEHCRRELDHAREANKRIVPVAHREVADAEVPAAVAQLNWIPQQGEFEDDFDGALAKLLEALEVDAEALRNHTRWQQRAEAWRDGARAGGLLATGAELREADRWLAEQTGRKPEPTPLQAEWVRAGRRLAARRQRLLFAGAVVALIISAILGILALVARNQAVDQRQTARSDELASDSISNLVSDPELSLILALEAARTNASDRSEQVLRRALVASHVRARIEPPPGGIAIDTARFSPDGDLVATAREDGSVQISDSESGEIARTLETGAAFSSDAEFSPDGRRLITSDSDGKAMIWSVDDGSRITSFDVTDSPLLTATFSPDGRSIAAGAQSGFAAVFDADGSNRRVLEGLSGRVSSIEFSADSDTVLTASSSEQSKDDGDGARIWDAASGSPVGTLGSGSASADAEFSPNGKAIVVAGNNGSASIFDAVSGRRLGAPLQPVDRGAFITRVAFVRGRDEVITGGSGGDVILWDLLSRSPVDRFEGHNGFILDLNVDSPGQRLATAGSDGTARVWDLGIRRATVAAAAIASPQFDASGERLMFADGLVRIVDPADGSLLKQFTATSAVFDAAYSPDGSRIAIGEADGRAELLDPGTGEPEGPTFDTGDADGVSMVRWDGEGRRLLTAGFSTGVEVWDVASGEQVGDLGLIDPEGSVFGADLSPDGETVVMTEGGEEAQIRRVSDGETVTSLIGHTGLIQTLEFDSSGDRVLSASDDGTARIWNAGSGEELLTLNNDGNPVRAAAWSPDGTLVATTGPAGDLRVWDSASGLQILSAAGANGPVALSDDLRQISAVDTFAEQMTVYECEVCGVALEKLERLAEDRITRPPTEQEQELYLDR